MLVGLLLIKDVFIIIIVLFVGRKSLNIAYELLVLQEGDFDERVFLNCANDIECSSLEQRDDQDFERSVLYYSGT